MRIRIIYSDLTEWIGDTKDYDKSPQTGTCQNCKGILTITVFYNKPNKLLMSGHDYYGVKDLETKVRLAIWSEYQRNGHYWEVDKKTSQQKYQSFQKENHPTDIIIRLGKWSSDKNMELANKQAILWL